MWDLACRALKNSTDWKAAAFSSLLNKPRQRATARSTGYITYAEPRISRVTSHFPAASSGEASHPIRLLACRSVQKDRLDS